MSLFVSDKTDSNVMPVNDVDHLRSIVSLVNVLARLMTNTRGSGDPAKQCKLFDTRVSGSHRALVTIGSLLVKSGGSATGVGEAAA